MAINVVTLKELWNQNTDGYLPVLMEIYNPDIAWTAEEKEIYKQDNGYLRIIADQSKVVYKGKTWLPCSFDFTAPESDGKKIGSASITISALDARVRKLLRTIKLTSELKLIASFNKVEKNTSGQFVYKFYELNSMTLQMKAATSNKSTATFSLVFSDALSQNVPYDIATQDRTPAVYD